MTLEFGEAVSVSATSLKKKKKSRLNECEAETSIQRALIINHTCCRPGQTVLIVTEAADCSSYCCIVGDTSSVLFVHFC